jgi:hypothetical protein
MRAVDCIIQPIIRGNRSFWMIPFFNLKNA